MPTTYHNQAAMQPRRCRRAHICSTRLLVQSAVMMSAIVTVRALSCAAGQFKKGGYSLALGDGFSCALLDTGSVKCWGNNTFGQLGVGDTMDRGGQQSEMGDALPAVDLGDDLGKTVMISGAAHHTCAILERGHVKCWGQEDSGKLGLGASAPDNHIGDAPMEMGDRLTAVPLGDGLGAASVAVGRHYTCVILEDGGVKCWGRRGTPMGIASDRVEAIPRVELGSGRSAVAVAVGAEHACAILDQGAVTWADSGAAQAVDLGAGHVAVSVAVGDHHACALSHAGLVSWGEGTGGVSEAVDLGSGASVTAPACAACTQSEQRCGAGYGLGTCGAWLDALCVGCSGKPARAEYVSQCAWICERGFAEEGGECKACACEAEHFLDTGLQLEAGRNGSAGLRGGCASCKACRANCSAEEQEVRACSAGGDRQCEACPSYISTLQCGAGFYIRHCLCTPCSPLPPNAIWVASCSWQCAAGHVVSVVGRRCIRESGLKFTARIDVNVTAYYANQAAYAAAVAGVAQVAVRKIAILGVVDIVSGSSRTVGIDTLVNADNNVEDRLIRATVTRNGLAQALAAAGFPLTNVEFDTVVTPAPSSDPASGGAMPTRTSTAWHFRALAAAVALAGSLRWLVDRN